MTCKDICVSHRGANQKVLNMPMVKNVVKNVRFLSFGRPLAVPAANADYECGRETRNVKQGCGEN